VGTGLSFRYTPKRAIGMNKKPGNGSQAGKDQWYHACSVCTVKFFSKTVVSRCPGCGGELLQEAVTQIPWDKDHFSRQARQPQAERQARIERGMDGSG